MQLTINRNLSFVLGMLLSLPTVYFIIISFLKFHLAYDYLYNSAEPFLQSAGLNESVGWNINFLLLFGPLAAFILNIISIVRIEWFNNRNEFSAKIFIYKHWLNLMVVYISLLVLVIIIVYGFVES